MKPLNNSIPKWSPAWDIQSIELCADIWKRCVCDHLKNVMSGGTTVFGDYAPESLLSHAERLLSGGPSDDPLTERFGALANTILQHSQNLHHPGYMGHQVPASNPIAGLFDAIGSMTNQPMAVFEMGPWATAVEHAVVRRMCSLIGWQPEASSGLLTSGGSMANLTALLTARNVAFPDAWENGVPDSASIIVHADAHYCITRAAGILGIGTRNILKAPLDDERRMDPEQLEAVIRNALAGGRKVIAVCACACATPIGAFDELSRIADVCEAHGIWLHVDAAHGGGILLSRQHRHLLDGIERADSVIWDAHKMMFVPALCGAVLYRNHDHRFEAFQQDAPYLFDPNDPGAAEFDGGLRTLECTKRSLAIGLWGVWSMFGDELFEQLVDRMFQLTAYLHRLVSEADDFEPLHDPQANIIAFRHLPERLKSQGLSHQNAFQRSLRASLVKGGDQYIVQTTINSLVALRVTMMNPMTSKSDIEKLVEQLRLIGRRLDQKNIASEKR